MLSFGQSRDLKKSARTFISLVVFLASSIYGYADENGESGKKEEEKKLKTEVALGKMVENSLALGKESDASAEFSVAIGRKTKATNMVKKYGTESNYEKRNVDGMVAIGDEAIVETHSSVAIGRNAKAWASSEDTIVTEIVNGKLTKVKKINRNNVAVGYMSQSGEAYSTGLGSRTRANGRFSTAIGSDAWIQEGGSRAVAIGNRATIGDEYKFARGDGEGTYDSDNAFTRELKPNMTGKQYGSIAIGRYSHVSMANGVALGHMAEVKQNNSVAIGLLSEANSVENAVALGSFSNVERDRYDLGYNPETGKAREMTGSEIDKIKDYNEVLNKVTRFNELNNKQRTFDQDKEYQNLEKKEDKSPEELKRFKELEAMNRTEDEEEELKKLSPEKVTYEKIENSGETKLIENEDLQIAAGDGDKISTKIKALEKERDERNKAWRSTSGAVSVGNAKKGITRQITNVAAGSEDTDAVNVAQLKSSVKMINEVRNGEAGIAVYTDKAGNRVKKALDGNYYTEDAFTNEGVLTEDSSKKVVVPDKLVISLAGKDMSMNHNIILRNVAAGEADNDAVNVGQLNSRVNKAMETNISFFNGGTYYTNNDTYDPGKTTFSMPLNKLSFDFGEGIKATKVGEVGKERVLITLDKEYIKNSQELKGPKGDPGAPGLSGLPGLRGPKGDPGVPGAQGFPGLPGRDGRDGRDGLTPEIKNGNWWIGGKDTGVRARGRKGKDGLTPEIKDGKWWIGDKDTGVKAEGPQGPQEEPGETGAVGPQGPQGEPGKDGAVGPQGDKGEAGIVSIETDKGSINISSGNNTSGEENSGEENPNTNNSSSLVIKGDDKNITTSIENGKVVVKLNNAIQGDKLTISNNGPEISKDGINANNTTITNIANGKKDSDAVNMGQLKTAQNNKLNKDLSNLTSEGSTVISNIAKDSIELVEGHGIDITKEEKDDKVIYTIETEHKIKYKSNGELENKVEVDSSKPKRKKRDLDAVMGEFVEVDGAIPKEVSAEEGLNFVNGKNTIATTAGHGVVSFHVGKDLKNMETITSYDGKDLTLTGNGTEVKLTKDKVSINDKKITGVADGEVKEKSKDAVNGGQLYVVAEEVKTKANKDLDNLSNKGESKVKELAKSSIEIKSEGKIKVTKVNDGDKDVYTVTSTSQEQLGYKTEDGKELVLKDNELFVKDGETERKATEKEKSSQKAHLKDAEGKADKEVRLSNIADGEISETSNDAVNGRQLRAVKNEVKTSLNQTNRRVDKLEESIARQNEKIESLRKDLNTGMAQLSAMSAVDFGHTKKKKVKIGAGLGGYKGERAVAVGVAISPTDNLLINAKMSMSAKDAKNAAFGVGATYEFNYD